MGWLGEELSFSCHREMRYPALDVFSGQRLLNGAGAGELTKPHHILVPRHMNRKIGREGGRAALYATEP